MRAERAGLIEDCVHAYLNATVRRHRAGYGKPGLRSLVVERLAKIKSAGAVAGQSRAGCSFRRHASAAAKVVAEGGTLCAVLLGRHPLSRRALVRGLGRAFRPRHGNGLRSRRPSSRRRPPMTARARPSPMTARRGGWRRASNIRTAPTLRPGWQAGWCARAATSIDRCGPARSCAAAPPALFHAPLQPVGGTGAGHRRQTGQPLARRGRHSHQEDAPAGGPEGEGTAGQCARRLRRARRVEGR